jgi:hypothetical protein
MKKIAFVPNDDGYGPSSLGFYIAKSFLEQGYSLIIRNKSAQDLNKNFYEDEINQSKVSLDPTFGGIKLKKTSEGIDFLGSFQNIVNYSKNSREYILPKDVDFVVDIGTPAGVRAAKKQRKPAFTVFDHSWGQTYQMLLDEFWKSAVKALGLKYQEKKILQDLLNRSKLKKAMERIKEDETQTRKVFLFPYYITPKCYYQYWKSLGVEIIKIGGVLGKPKVTRGKARKRMGIGDNDPEKIVYILGGGTSVWDAKLPQMISQLRGKKLKCNVVIFDRGIKEPGKYERLTNNLFKIGPVKGETIQGILPGVDLVITRAGGGIVNDAIACRVPFVCVEEPGHVQVEMIRKNCMGKTEKDRLTRTILIDDFRTKPIDQIIKEELVKQKDDNRKLRERMSYIENGMEKYIVDGILSHIYAIHTTHHE